MEAFNTKGQSKTDYEKESVSIKLLREAQLAGEAVLSIPRAAVDTLQNHKVETIGKAALAGGFSAGMSLLSQSKSIRVVTAAAFVSVASDLVANGSKIADSFIDNWHSERNWQKNVDVLQNTVGRFSVDFAVGSLAGIGADAAMRKLALRTVPTPTALATFGPEFPVNAGAEFRTSIISEGRSRKFDIHLPRGLDPSRPTDVLMAFDGVQINREPAIPGLGKLADKHNFIAIVPHADANVSLPGFKLSSWNAPGVGVFSSGKPIFGRSRAYNDANFVNDILETVDQRVKIGQIGLAGFSEGAGMAMHLAGILPKEKLLGVVSLSGAVLGTEGPIHKGLTTVIVLGAKDKTLPIDGGSYGPTRWLDWLGHNKVSELSKPLSLAPRLAEHHGITTRPLVSESNGVIETVYSAGELAPGKVHQFLIKAGEHAWPGKREAPAGVSARLMRWINGEPADFDINERIANLIMKKRIHKEFNAPHAMPKLAA